MKRALGIGIVLAAVGGLFATPVPAETRKPAAFPAGHYVLAGSGEAARGDDVMELTKTFRLRQGQYVLSGGPKPTDEIVVDDDLEVYQDGKALFIDNDHVRSTEDRGKLPATYQGTPIVLVLDPTKKVQIVAIDCCQTDAILGEVWLHRWDGARKKLTDRISQPSRPNLPAKFFDESFNLTDGFVMPDKVSTNAATELPAKPASLLPRFKPAVKPPAPLVNKPQRLEPGEFVKHAVLEGLTEDGVPPLLAAALAQQPDFLGKCPICQPTLFALKEYGKLKDSSAPKEGKGMAVDLARRLASKENDVRREALREMVAGYVERGYARIEMSAEQCKTLEKELLTMRGNPKNTGALAYCPSCDGACRILPKK